MHHKRHVCIHVNSDEHEVDEQYPAGPPTNPTLLPCSDTDNGLHHQLLHLPKASHPECLTWYLHTISATETTCVAIRALLETAAHASGGTPAEEDATVPTH
jgi:hypothetical protein